MILSFFWLLLLPLIVMYLVYKYSHQVWLAIGIGAVFGYVLVMWSLYQATQIIESVPFSWLFKIFG